MSGTGDSSTSPGRFRFDRCADGRRSDDPWVVATPMRARDAERLSKAASLRDDPDVRAFEARVPAWASEGHALVTWMPLELQDIVRGALRSLRG